MTAALTGAVLAGGRGSRMGGISKASVELGGEALIAPPLAALAAVCARVAVVCKPDTRLPPLPAGVGRWEEPVRPRHPLVGILHALERAGGPVLVCAADMPFVTAEACRAVVAAASEGGLAVAAAGGRIEPLLAVYPPAALPALRAAPEGARLTATVEALGPVRVPLAVAVVRSVNTGAELAAAAAELGAA